MRRSVRHYVTVTLSEAFRDGLRTQLDEALLGDLGSLAALKKRLAARLGELSAREDQYLELVGSPGWPKEKIRGKLDVIRIEREEISGQLADATSRLAAGREFFLAALALLRDPKAFYDQAGTSLKRAMSKIIFTKLCVDGEEISDHVLGEVVRDLVEADLVVRGSGGKSVVETDGDSAESRGQNTNSRPHEEAAG